MSVFSINCLGLIGLCFLGGGVQAMTSDRISLGRLKIIRSERPRVFAVAILFLFLGGVIVTLAANLLLIDYFQLRD